MVVQFGLIPTWSETLKKGFLMTWLNMVISFHVSNFVVYSPDLGQQIIGLPEAHYEAFSLVDSKLSFD